MKPLLLAFLIAALAITAAYQDTMSTASPEEADEVEVVSSLPSTVELSALPAFEKEQARLDELFDTLVEHQARTEDLIQDHSSEAMPFKRKFSYLAYYVFSEIPPDEKPANTVLK